MFRQLRFKKKTINDSRLIHCNRRQKDAGLLCTVQQACVFSFFLSQTHITLVNQRELYYDYGLLRR